MHSNEYRRRGLSAYAVYLLFSGGRSLFFALVFTVNMIYFVTVLELDPLQLVLVGTALEASAFLFEVPTGVVADVFSRRLSIIIGTLLTGVAFLVEGAIPVYGVVIVSQVLWGIGYTFTSGATEAWIADEIGEERAGPAFMRGAQAGSIGGILGTLIAMGLAAITQINIPIILGGVMFLALGLFLIVLMPENGFKRAADDERRSWGALFATFRDGVRLVSMKPVLIGILVIGTVYGIASEGFDRLSTKHLIDGITLPSGIEPVVLLGSMGLIGRVFNLGANEIVRRRVDLTNPQATAWAAMLLNLGIAGGILLLALTNNLIIAILALWCIGSLRATSEPVFMAWINQSLDPKVRATVLSMSGQVDALGQVVGGPAVGLVGNLVSVRAALTVSAIIWAAATPLYRRSLRQPAAPAVEVVGEAGS